MGGMNSLGGPGVWQGGQGGMQNLGQFGALGYPVQPGPTGQAALEHFGQQVPDQPQQTMLFGGLEHQHPLLAKMLEGAVVGGAMTPGPEPGRAEGAGGGISRTLQGVLGARGAERQFQISQIMAPYQLARQTAELQGAAQEQEARKAQIGEMRSRADYFDAMANMTAPQARLLAAQGQVQLGEDKIKSIQGIAQQKSDDYNAYHDGMIKWHVYDTDMKSKASALRNQVMFGIAKQKLQGIQQFTKYAKAANDQYTAAVKDRDDLGKQLKDYTSTSIEYLQGMTDPNSTGSKKAADLQRKFDVAQMGVEAAEGVQKEYSKGLNNYAATGLTPEQFQEDFANNPTNPLGSPGGELGAGRTSVNPADPLGILSPKK